MVKGAVPGKGGEGALKLERPPVSRQEAAQPETIYYRTVATVGPAIQKFL